MAIEREAGWQVILIAADALNHDAAEDFARLIEPGCGAVQCLVRADDAAGLALADAAAAAGLAVEVLQCAGATPPMADQAYLIARMPGTVSSIEQAKADADEFAFGLVDALLVPAEGETPLVRRAREYGKAIVPTIAGRPAATRPRRNDDLLSLDPEGDRRWWGRAAYTVLGWWSGRIEQPMLIIFIYCGQLVRWSPLRRFFGAHKPDPWPPVVGAFRSGFTKAFAWRSTCTPYFAPNGWRGSASDAKIIDVAAPMMARYNQLDRGALFGARLHRDVIWIVHLAAATAVFAAVAGHIAFLESRLGDPWPAVEFGLLVGLILVPVVWTNRARLQERWMACRLAAEQLRIAALCLPLMVLPPALRSADPPTDDRHDDRSSAMALVKRAVRDHGLPRHTPGTDLTAAIAWVRLIVGDQIAYHAGNEIKLERAEQGLKLWTYIVFFIVLLVVSAHLIADASDRTLVFDRYVILITAAGPAFAAALHAIGTRLDLVHRADLSHDALAALTRVEQRLEALVRNDEPVADPWAALRAETIRASEAMSAETDTWHRLVLMQTVTLS